MFTERRLRGCRARARGPAVREDGLARLPGDIRGLPAPHRLEPHSELPAGQIQDQGEAGQVSACHPAPGRETGGNIQGLQSGQSAGCYFCRG